MTLGDLGYFIRGNGMQKSDLVDSGFPAIHYGQIHTSYTTAATETLSFVAQDFARNLRKAEPGDLIIATTSEDDEAVAKALVWLGDTTVAVSGDAYIYHHSLVPKYASYFFQSDQFQGQKRRGITGTKVRRISGDGLAKIQVPVPPVEVQREIVRILDGFTALKAALKAELEARRRQYAYYRDSLLAFPMRTAGPGGRVASRIEDLIKPLGPNGVGFEVLDSFLERGTNVRWSDVPGKAFQYIDLTSVDRTTHTIGETETITSENAPSRAQQIVREGDVLFATTRPMLKRFCVVPAEFDGQIASTGYCVLRPKSDRLLTNFLFHLIGTADFYEYVVANERGASYPAIPDAVVKEFRIPIPSVEVQREIVRVLDLFVTLEAELDKRRVQYEYYRDRLLTFEELEG